jgi:hypothetical protein
MRSILPCCFPYGKAGGLQFLCCQEIKVTDYNFTLDALALKPSGFCNVRAYSFAESPGLDPVVRDDFRFSFGSV